MKLFKKELTFFSGKKHQKINLVNNAVTKKNEETEIIIRTLL
jgi:hypothetical protein